MKKFILALALASTPALAVDRVGQQAFLLVLIRTMMGS